MTRRKTPGELPISSGEKSRFFARAPTFRGTYNDVPLSAKRDTFSSRGKKHARLEIPARPWEKYRERHSARLHGILGSWRVCPRRAGPVSTVRRSSFTAVATIYRALPAILYTRTFLSPRRFQRWNPRFSAPFERARFSAILAPFFSRVLRPSLGFMGLLVQRGCDCFKSDQVLD